MRRIFNVVASVVALTVFLPIMIMVAAAILITMGRPVIFRQIRPGLHAQPFEMLKFRTMTNASDSAGNPLFDGARVTKLGSFLRRTSLDELPELWNVVKGDMNLVGPRPLLMDYLLLYSSRQHRRHEVRPGVTGWAQINGRNAIGWDEKFELDIWYVDNHNFSLDILILWRTIRKVILREGISQAGEVTMSKFTGSSK